jgi:hypothetical protein
MRKPDELILHGIEIKVSESDLQKDSKYTEYKDFVNYLWLAVPVELKLLAKNNVPKGTGVISFDNLDASFNDRKINIVKATYNDIPVGNKRCQAKITKVTCSHAIMQPCSINPTHLTHLSTEPVTWGVGCRTVISNAWAGSTTRSKSGDSGLNWERSKLIY